MADLDDGEIGVPFEPDFTNFANKVRTGLSTATRNIDNPTVKVDAVFSKTQIRKAFNVASAGANLSVKVKLDVTARGLKTQLNTALKGVAPEVKVKVSLAKGVRADLRKEIGLINAALPKLQIQPELKRGSAKLISQKLQSQLKLEPVVQVKAPSRAYLQAVRKEILFGIGTISVPVRAQTSVVRSVTGGAVGGSSGANTKDTRVLTNNVRVLDDVLRGNTRTFLNSSRGLSTFALTAGVAAAGVVGLTAAVVRFGFESAKNFETSRRSIESFIGAQKGVKDKTVETRLFFDQLQEFSEVTPFNLENVTKASKSLFGAGFKTQNIIPALTDIGDLGAQLGASGTAIERVAVALAKIKGQGKVTQRELRAIFTAFPGFNPFEALSENLEQVKGFSRGAVVTEITKGAIKADDAIDALLEGMAKYPSAAGAMYRQSLTAAGSFETLQDRAQKASRLAIGPSLPFLARDMRKASLLMSDGADDIGTGLTDAFRVSGQLIEPFFKIAIPLVNEFSGAIADSIPTVADFLDEFGEPLTESFGAFIQLMPALVSTAGAFVSVIEPATPAITAFAKGLNLIPGPLLSIVAAYKLFNSVTGKFGLLGRTKGGISSIAGPPNPSINAAGSVIPGIRQAEQAQQGFFKRTAAGFKGLKTQAARDYDAIGAAGTRSAGRVSSAYQKQVQVIQGMRAESVKTIGQVQRASEEITRTTGRATSSSALASGLLQKNEAKRIQENLNATNRYFKETNKLSVNSARVLAGSANQASITSLSAYGKFVAGSKTLTTSLVTGLGAVKNASLSAGKSLVGALGGPAGIAITAATIGLTVLYQKWQDNKQAAKEYAEEAKLAAEATALDVTSETRFESAQAIIGELSKLDKTKKDIDGALSGIGFSKSQFNRITAGKRQTTEKGPFEIKSGSTGYDELGGVAKIAIREGLTNADLAKLTNSKKKRDKLLKDLRSADKAETGVSDLFRNTDADKLNTKAKQIDNAVKQVLKTYKETGIANAKLARDLGRKDLAKTFDAQAKYVDKHKELPKNIQAISKANADLLSEQAKTKDGALAAALGLEDETDAMKNLGGATQLAEEQLAELNSAIADSSVLLDTFSFDQVLKGLRPEQFGALASTYGNLLNTGEDAGSFVESFILNAGLSDDPETRKQVVEAFSGFRRMLTDEYQAMIDDFKSKLPGISTIFEEKLELTGGTVGAKALAERTATLTKYISDFTTDISTIATKNYGDVASLLAAQGPGVAGLAADQLAKDLEAGKTTLAQALQTNYDNFKAALIKAGSDLSLAAKMELAKTYGIDPSFIVSPEFTLEIDEEKKKTFEAQLAEFYKERNRIVQESSMGGGGAGLLPSSITPGSSTLREDLAGIDAKIATTKAQIEQLSSASFEALTTQATTTAGAMNLAFSQANINGAIQPQIDAVTEKLTELPATIATNISGATASSEEILQAGASLGLQYYRGFKEWTETSFALAYLDLIDPVKAIGTNLGQAMADGFNSKSQIIKDAILGPFRNTRDPLNKYIAALQALGVSVGAENKFTTIPQFHSGGVVGRDKQRHRGGLKDREQMAVLKKGEGVLPNDTMNRIGVKSFDLLRKGKIGQFGAEIGGPPKVSDEAASSVDSSPYKKQIKSARDGYFSAHGTQLPSLQYVKLIADQVVQSFHNSSNKYVDKLVPNMLDFGSAFSIPLTGDTKNKYDQLAQRKGQRGSWTALAGLMKSSGVPHRITSTVRPGSITSSGNLSLHSPGRAIDIAGVSPGVNTAALGNIFKSFGPYESLLAELIYSGDQVGYNIKNGTRVGKYAQKDHRNHVHAALYSGGLIPSSRDGNLYRLGEKHQREVVLPMNQPRQIYRVMNQALDKNYFNSGALQAMHNAMGGSKASSVDNSKRTVNNNEISLIFEGRPDDDNLFAGIVARRLKSAFRKVG